MSALLRRFMPVAMPLAYTVFTLLVYWQLWTPIDGARGFWRYDPRYDYWGDLVFQYQTLADGHLALWNPYDRGGFPLYGDPQPGMLYPLNWIFWLWGAITGSLPSVAITVKILLHWVIGAVGMHLFLRRLGAAEPGCYLGGVLFGWTNPKFRYGGSTLNWSLAWIPWVLLAMHWFAEKPGWRRGAVLGTSAAMLLLAGAPAVLLYAFVIIAPYGIYALRGKWRQAIRPLGLAALVAALWVLPLIASNLAQYPESVRKARDLAFITGSAFSPADFVGFLVPRISGENVYYGLLPLLCIGVLVASAGRARALLLLGVAAVGVALALGQHAGFMGATASALPPFGLFRHAHRYLYITSIAVAVLAGLGLARLLVIQDQERKNTLAKRIVWIGGATTFALSIAYLVSVIVHDPLFTPKNVAFGLGFVAAAVGTWLLRAIVLTTGKRQMTYAWIAVVVVALDLWAANAAVIARDFTRPPPRTPRDATLETLADVRTTWRVYDRGFIDYRPGTRLKIRDFGGYEDDPLGLSRYAAFLTRAKADVGLLGHANVRYLLQNDRTPILAPRPGDNARLLQSGIHELTNVAPAVMYVPAPVPVHSVDEAVKTLKTITPGQGAVVEIPVDGPSALSGGVPAGPADAPVTAGAFTRFEPNHVIAEIDAPGPGLVVIAEAYYPAWRATVNGEPAAILPANAMFRGVVVPAAGHYRIEMRLRPLRFWGLLPAYLCAWAIFLWVVAGFAGRWRARRRGPRSPRSNTPPRSDPTTA
jgi:hypothetical protein